MTLRRLSALCLSVLLPLAVAPRSRAMDFKPAPQDTGMIIVATGEIIPGDSLKLGGFLEAITNARIIGYVLNSPGGNLEEGEKLSGMIHNQSVTVAVPSGAMCASACFLLFAAAAHRVVAPDALIGVHSVSDGSGQEDDTTLALTTILARDAAAYNVPAQILGELVTTQPGQITWLNVAELTSMGAAFLRPNPPGMPSQEPVTTAQPEEPPSTPSVAKSTPIASVPLGSATASIPPSMSPAYISGLGDRKIWESWFAAQTGAVREGAAFWAGQRSLPHVKPCDAAGVVKDPMWLTGCQQAAQMLAPFDVRRRLEPDYKRGWNAI